MLPEGFKCECCAVLFFVRVVSPARRTRPLKPMAGYPGDDAVLRHASVAHVLRPRHRETVHLQVSAVTECST